MSTAKVDTGKMDAIMRNLFLMRTVREINRIRAEMPDVWTEVQRRKVKYEQPTAEQQNAPD